MSRKLIIQPVALGDISEIGDRYDQYNESLRDGFLKAVDRALTRLVQNPFQFQIVYRQFRRVLVNRFPYALFYVVSENEINVVACIHGRRNLARMLRRR